jgi:dTDP-4-dehydrorhamnose reductase
MNVLVTGIMSQLGFDVMNVMAKRGHTGVGVDIDEMDITSLFCRKPIQHSKLFHTGILLY